MLPGEKNVQKLKIMFYISGLAEALSPESSLSDSPEGLLQGSKGGAWIHRSFCNETRYLEHQKITVN